MFLTLVWNSLAISCMSLASKSLALASSSAFAFSRASLALSRLRLMFLVSGLFSVIFLAMASASMYFL